MVLLETPPCNILYKYFSLNTNFLLFYFYPITVSVFVFVTLATLTLDFFCVFVALVVAERLINKEFNFVLQWGLILEH